MTPATRAFYADSAQRFLEAADESIVAQLALRVGLEHSGDEALQIGAWREQVAILKTALAELDRNEWGVLLELPLLRLGRRIDAVILAGSRVLVIEFKIGAKSFARADLAQAIDYALCLRDFHGASRALEIVPIVCASQAGDQTHEALEFLEGVSACMKVNAATLAGALQRASDEGAQIDWRRYDQSSYSPTPDIVAAARAIYAGHSVAEIGRSDAEADSLRDTAAELQRLIESARENGERIVCFVTGEPGSGKTLLGLELVFAKDAGRVVGAPAALLSGNRPLVFVLQEAIAQDARARTGVSIEEARRRSLQALQTLLGYLKDHGEAGAPPENVIVFDEAQRAWDSATGLKLLGREKSEPELFLEIMGRLPWACLVCLVGPGQEINRGEGGLGLWGEALARADGAWKAYAAPSALNSANGLRALVADAPLPVEVAPKLHLKSSVRAYRNAGHGLWVEALLAGAIARAREIANGLSECPAFVTRDLAMLKNWLETRRRGERRVGLLASSGAVRLIGDGLPPSPRSNDLQAVVHWFLRPAGDYRSSNALETPLSEFVCQGLELDYVGLYWGHDLVWREEAWAPRRMSAPNWRSIQSEDGKRFRLNAYRVLLTRARAGMAIFVPHGASYDPTRDSALMDDTYSALLAAGCISLGAER